MFKSDLDHRLSMWYALRKKIDESNNPLELVSEFWGQAPLVSHNYRIDPYDQTSWPTPWDIIHTNIYDDFTVAVMIAYTIRLTGKFKNSKIEIKVMANKENTKLYNLVIVDNTEILNYHRFKVAKLYDHTDLMLELGSNTIVI
jgi:hypothetical protein